MTKKSEILKEAKYNLETGYGFICHAIEAAKIGTEAQRGELREWVQNDLLRGSYTYDSWLEDNYPELYAVWHTLPSEKMEAARIEWVKWMIQYWEGLGE